MGTGDRIWARISKNNFFGKLFISNEMVSGYIQGNSEFDQNAWFCPLWTSNVNYVKSFEHSILDVSQGLNIQSETRLSDCGDGMWANGGTRMGGRTPLPLAHSSQILPGMKVRMKSGHRDGQSDWKVPVKATRGFKMPSWAPENHHKSPNRNDRDHLVGD